MVVGVASYTLPPVQTVQAIGSIAFLQAANSDANAAEYTFSAQNLGTAAADRQIIVVTTARKVGAVTTVSMTIGGVSATQVQLISAGANANHVAIFIANVPTGATGDIVVTWGATMVRSAIMAYGGYDFVSATPTDGGTSTAAAPTFAIDVVAGGFAIGGATTEADTSTTWTGITEDADASVEAGLTYTSASDDFATTQTNLALTATFLDEGGDEAGAFSSWELVVAAGAAPASEPEQEMIIFD